jgi:hypothetical protein
MRKTAFVIPLVVVALGGLTGGMVNATGTADPASPPDTTPGSDIFADLGLTPEQTQCLVESAGNIDTSDLTALTNLMSECGISLEQLMQIGQETETVATVEAVPETVGPPASEPSVEIDPAAATAALAALGLDQTAVDCLVAEAATATPDDPGAEGAFNACGVGPAQLLAGIVALAEAGTGSDAAPPATAEVAEAPPGSVASTGNPMVDMLLEQLAAQGINLDAEQGQCLLENIADFDPNDVTSIANVLQTCGIELSDIVPGG